MLWLVFALAFEIAGEATKGSEELCRLPPELSQALVRTWPESRVVTAADLEPEHRKMFREDHGDRCPGVVKVDFYGTGRDTYAIAMISGRGQAGRSILLVATLTANRWRFRRLETTDAVIVPLVWTEPPGTYEGIYKQQTLRARNPVIVFTGYESWSILYAWTGKRVKKIWLAD